MSTNAREIKCIFCFLNTMGNLVVIFLVPIIVICDWNIRECSPNSQFTFYSILPSVMDPHIKKEALKLETSTTHALSKCFDMCVDYRNPQLRKSPLDYISDATETLKALNPTGTSTVGDGSNDLSVDEIHCLERCSIKYIQTQRVVMHGIAKRQTPLKEAAAELLKM